MSPTDKKTTTGILALSAIALIAACVIFGTLSTNEEVRVWANGQIKLYQELQAVHDEFKSAEILHDNYIITGNPEQLNEFNACVQRLNAALQALHQEGNERFNSIETKVKGAVEQFRLTTTIRREQNFDAARALMMTSREMRETRGAAKEIADAEAYQVKLLQLRLETYTTTLQYVRALFLAFAALLASAYFFINQKRQPALTSAEESNRLLDAELSTTKAQLERLQSIDFLTEVLNIRGLEQAMAVEQNRTGRVGGHTVALLANCDNFRRINEGLGHAVGDVVLKEVAKRIGSILRPSDYVARVGGDEFLVILPDTQLAYAMRVAERIRVGVADTPLRNASQVINLTVSIGVATLEDQISSIAEIMSATRPALKRSKQSGKNKVSLAAEGTPEDETPAVRDIVEVLCDGSHFRTVFQPVIDLSTEQISGYEIFTRGPDGAFESPADFFRVCVENNILTTVDLLCLKLCIATVSNIREDLRFHINLFPSTLLDTPVDNLLALFPADRGGKQFCIEISEQHFIGDPGYLREHINAFKNAGILVAIDDVGFGRNSLESLILLEPDLVKVDRKYVTGVANEPAKQRLLKRVVNVARSLGSEVVAEGIEVQDDLPVLKEIGIHYGQGYYWGGLIDTVPSAGSKPAFSGEKR